MSYKDFLDSYYWKKDCVFCSKLKDGSAEQYGEASATFIPLNPCTDGHRLFIPRVHVERGDRRFEKLMGSVYLDAFDYADSAGIDYNLIINVGKDATQTIDHLHVHYVPRTPQDGLSLPWRAHKEPPINIVWDGSVDSTDAFNAYGGPPGSPSGSLAREALRRNKSR